MDIYDKVQNFVANEDFNAIRSTCLSKNEHFYDKAFTYVLPILEWRRPKEFVDRPKFIDDKPSRFDALQGAADDCWLISAMQSITLYENLFKHVVPSDNSFYDNYVGVFHFRIWHLGTWYDVVIDDRLPFNTEEYKLQNCHSMSGDVFWAALLEKAYCKFLAGDVTTAWDHNATYDLLDYGRPVTSFQNLSGGIVESILIKNPPAYIESDPPSNVDTFKELLFRIMTKNVFMTVRGDSANNEDDVLHPDNEGLLPRHPYTVTAAYKWADDDSYYHGLFLVRLLNPWGVHEWTGPYRDDDYPNWWEIDRKMREKLGVVFREDGEFWMTEWDMESHFGRLEVCYLYPYEYAEVRLGYVADFINWQTISYRGEWVAGVSAVGMSIDKRHMNPQIAIKLASHSDDDHDTHPVVIEVAHWKKGERLSKPDLGVYIYLLNKSDPLPLTKEYMKTHNPIGHDPEFDLTLFGRSYLKAMKLEAGDYCLVPCTREEGKSTQFLIRVFSGFQMSLSEPYDKKISKTLPKIEQSMYESDDELKKLFDNVVKGNDGLDWEGLKEILNTAMNSNRSSLGMVSSFKNYIKLHTFFKKCLNLMTSSDIETGEVGFTKEECRNMIAMLDHEHSGRLSFPEFKTLWNNISFWREVYERHRGEKESRLAVAQLQDALSSIGYDVNKRALHSLSYVYADDEGKICLTDFILCGVTLETILSNTQSENGKNVNTITLTLENWVRSTLNL